MGMKHLLQEKEKERIRHEHRALLEKQQHELEGKVAEQQHLAHEDSVHEERESIVREEEEKFYQDKPDYISVKDKNGNIRWMLKSEFSKKRFRKHKIKKKRTHRKSRRILERLSVVFIIIAMVIIAIIAYRSVT